MHFINPLLSYFHVMSSDENQVDLRIKIGNEIYKNPEIFLLNHFDKYPLNYMK